MTPLTQSPYDHLVSSPKSVPSEPRQVPYTAEVGCIFLMIQPRRMRRVSVTLGMQPPSHMMTMTAVRVARHINCQSMHAYIAGYIIRHRSSGVAQQANGFATCAARVAGHTSFRCELSFCKKMTVGAPTSLATCYSYAHPRYSTPSYSYTPSILFVASSKRYLRMQKDRLGTRCSSASIAAAETSSSSASSPLAQTQLSCCCVVSPVLILAL